MVPSKRFLPVKTIPIIVLTSSRSGLNLKGINQKKQDSRLMKFQNTNLKFQINSKYEITIFKHPEAPANFGFSRLNIEIYLPA